jgi:hypothetical protein
MSSPPKTIRVAKIYNLSERRRQQRLIEDVTQSEVVRSGVRGQECAGLLRVQLQAAKVLFFANTCEHHTRSSVRTSRS